MAWLIASLFMGVALIPLVVKRIFIKPEPVDLFKIVFISANVGATAVLIIQGGFK